MFAGLVGLSAAALFALNSLHAQVAAPTETAAPAVPSVRILKGALVSPTTAAAYYTSTAATDGLCRDFGPSGLKAQLADICPSSGRPREPEIKELARALRNDPDLIYEYVRNRIDTEFLFGAHKGALGVVIDASGTPFDQAKLLVELLREAGYAASYRYGTVTLDNASFTAWTGLSQAKAACEFLATSGVPATINGASPSDCALSGNVSSVTMAHVWVQVQINGQSVSLDPSLKIYEHIQTLPTLKTDMGFAAGDAGSTARQGAQQGAISGQDYVADLNDSGLETRLRTQAAALINRIGATPESGHRDLRGGGVWDLVGGRRLKAATRPSGGWRGGEPSNYAASATWSAIPDVYRARLVVAADRPWGGGVETVFSSVSFFVDEIYGRRLEIASTQMACSTQSDPGCSYQAYAPTLILDGVTLLTSTSVSDLDLLPLNVDLAADHPFAAENGTFGDATVEKKAEFVASMSIVHGWGATSSALSAKWSAEQGVDRQKNATQQFTEENAEYAEATEGDLLRARVGAAWLAQADRARNIHAELANARAVHFHSLGLVSADQHRNGFPRAYAVDVGQTVPESLKGFSTVEEATVVDVETSFGLIQRTGDAATRRAALHAIAATSALLEGGVLEQLTGTPDAASSVRRLAWGNRPESGETPSTASRKAYRYQTSDASTIMGTVVGENLSSGVHGAFTPSGGPQQAPLAESVVNRFRGRLANTIAQYRGLGYDVTASSEALLGPGHRQGAEALDYISYPLPGSYNEKPLYQYSRRPSLQVGGAIIATRYDASGDPDRIAHTLTRYGDISKGAGSEPGEPGTFDPNKAADHLKDNWIDRSAAVGVNLSSGAAGFSTPTLRSVGQGEFPHKLELNAELRGVGVSLVPVETSHYPRYGRDGVVTNWEASASFGSSAMSAMGEGRLENVAQTVVAYVNMQDVWRETPSAWRDVIGALVADWWADTVVNNTITVTQGGSSEQYVRQEGGVYVARTGAAKVEIVGQPTALRPYSYGFSVNTTGADQKEELSRHWKMEGVSIRAFGSGSDVRVFSPIGVLPAGSRPLVMAGPTVRKQWNFRMTDWDFPSGVELTLNYAEAAKGVRPTSVSSNLGYSLAIPAAEIPEALATFGDGATMEYADAANGIYRADFRGRQLRTISSRPVGTLQLSATYTPSSAAAATVAYVYDTVGRVKEGRDAIATAFPASRGAHQFFIAEGYRGERQDPLGGRYAVETLEDGRYQRTIDELGRVSTASYDGRGRLLSRTSAWGDTTRFAYDARDNVITKTRTPIAGCGVDVWWCQTSVIQATYHSTWNKPTSVILPATVEGQASHVWTWSYNGQGLVSEQSSPLVYNARIGAYAHAVTKTWYDAYGRVTKVEDPTGVAIIQVWGGGGLPAYCLRQSIGASQLGGLSLTTNFGCNTTGDVTSVTDPRGHTTATGYDALRRKTAEVGPSGTNVQTQWVYDLNGNVTEEKKWDTTASAWRIVTTTYSLTNQPLTVTDPSGDVSRTCYDALDRPTKTIDPTGRAKQTDYNLAGQPTEIHQFLTGSPTDASCTLTVALADGATTTRWRAYQYNAGGLQSAEIDANGNATTVDYDGLGRPFVTHYADGGWSADYRNERDQVVVVRKRSGDWQQAAYDEIGRVYHIWEHGPNDAGLIGRNTRTGYDLSSKAVWKDVATQTSAAWDENQRRDVRTYVYDAAGRVTSEAYQPRNGSMGETWLTTQYGYDASSNRTSITWPNGFAATYGFDALNRPTSVGFGGHSAATTYNSLGQRTGLSRSNGTGTTWSFEPDGDLSGIGHSFAAGNAIGSPSFAYGHDAAGRMTSVSVNVAQFEWTPSTGYARTYDPANALNQITSGSQGSLSYDLNGNMTFDQANTVYGWTYGNRLSGASRTGMTASYGYDSEDRRTVKIVNGVMTRTLWSGTEEIAHLDEAGHILRYIIPDGSGQMDGRLAVLDISGAIRWIHTDHQGSTAAVTDNAGVVQGAYAYSPYGESNTTGGSLGANLSWFGYTGREFDAETGNYQYRARYYHPTLGRFLSTDPIGTKDDPNLYGYVANDPVNGTDPTGMFGCTAFGNISCLPPASSETRAQQETFRDGVARSEVQVRGEILQVIGTGMQIVGNLSGARPVTAAGVVVSNAGTNLRTTTAVPVTPARQGPVATAPYRRPSNATTPQQRASVQGQPCEVCGASTPRQVAGHREALVREHYETGTIDTQRMRSVDAVRPECPPCSAAEGGRLSHYSRQQRARLPDE